MLLLAPHLRTLLFDLDRIAGAGDKARRGLAVLKSFVGAINIKIGEVDLPNLFVAVGEAAEERSVGVAILIDEIQYFSSSELSALIMAMHKMQQRQLPLVLIAAGLPILPGLAGDAKSYAERLFSFPDVGPLPESEASKALQGPVRKAGEEFDADALHEIFRLTHGYPYFLQEWGYQAWNHATVSPISLQVVKESSDLVSKRLDENFFRVRFDRLTPREKDYLRAMAELGQGPYRTGDVADKLGVKINTLGPVRANLMKKGMVYSPSHGEMAFTVPLFDEFMRRIIPNFQS